MNHVFALSAVLLSLSSAALGVEIPRQNILFITVDAARHRDGETGRQAVLPAAQYLRPAQAALAG